VQLKAKEELSNIPPTQKPLTRVGRNYPKKKRMMYDELQALPRNYAVIALARVTKVRGAQLMALRKRFRNDIKIRIVKNKVAQRAFEKVSDIPNLPELGKELEGQCALMFTNLSPFKLNLLFDQNKVFLPAKGGDIASKEIVIPAGNTGLNPGPVLSEFKEVNVPTRIDQGTVWVVKDTTVAKRGGSISQKLASLLSKLGIKPVEAGIRAHFAIAEGLSLRETDLLINLLEYREKIVGAFQGALAFAIEAAYVTTETLKPLFIKAHRHAIALARESGYLSSDTIEFFISETQAEVHTLANQVKKKGYLPL
jgi:large subunit ribosomal protein L10